MADTAFGATIANVLDLLQGTVAGDFDASGSSSVPVGEAEITAELARQERAMRIRMSADLAAKVAAKSGPIPDLADVCAICAAARLGLRAEGADGSPPLHVAQLAADCDAALSLLANGKLTPSGLGSLDVAAPVVFGCIPCARS